GTFWKSYIVCCTQLREAEMLTPRANSKLKRKRAEKQSPNLTIGKDKENDATEEITSNGGFLSTPLAYSPQNVRSPAIFILDNASLKKGLVRKKWKILNSDEDAQFLQKQKKNLNDYRPDIIHEALRCILDSPLNKAGMVGAIYVKIDQGGVFEVKPHVRIPRTCSRFCGVMMDLLQKSSVRAKDANEVLLRVVEEPITRHLPANSYIVGLSYTSKKLVDIEEYVSVWSNDLSPVFVVGTMVNGKVEGDYMHDYISVSEYPLAAKYCLGMICEALEQKWKIF
ncbi:Ribosomal RNA small subunit methyltransferase NEP1, partial [Mucuna pruriens]